jgi:hypothetical protein
MLRPLSGEWTVADAAGKAIDGSVCVEHPASSQDPTGAEPETGGLKAGVGLEFRIA